MTPFQPHLICFLLTSLLILPLLISLVKSFFWMFLVPIICRTCRMWVCDLSAERTHITLKIWPISHLSFLKTQRVNIFSSRLPLYPIHQFLRMPTNISNFLILVILIYSLPHLIMTLIPSLLIYPRHWSTMIYLSTKLKPLRLSRHFSLSWWLCQALAVLRLASLLVRKFLKHSRLLITLCFA